MPLLPKRCRDNDKNLPFALSPSLGKENPGFNSLSKTHFVGEDCPFR
jgi:hypothetical protein